jgi:hypothetical protein
VRGAEKGETAKVSAWGKIRNSVFAGSWVPQVPVPLRLTWFVQHQRLVQQAALQAPNITGSYVVLCTGRPKLQPPIC